MKEAKKQEKARATRRATGFVVVSHKPPLVTIGVRIWKAKMVPVGRRLARFAELCRARVSTVWGDGVVLGCISETMSFSGSGDVGIANDLCLRAISFSFLFFF